MRQDQPPGQRAPSAPGGPGGRIAATVLAPSAEHGAAWHAQASRARLLAWVSLAWMAGEGTLGLVAGARSGSVSLTGWAAGSAIEALASVIVIGGLPAAARG